MASWEDFLDSFDQAQPDIKITWGPDSKQPPRDRRKQQKINLDKLAGGMAPKPAAVNKLSPQDLERIKKLEAQLNAPGRTEAEKENARRMIENIKNRG